MVNFRELKSSSIIRGEGLKKIAYYILHLHYSTCAPLHNSMLAPIYNSMLAISTHSMLAPLHFSMLAPLHNSMPPLYKIACPYLSTSVESGRILGGKQHELGVGFHGLLSFGDEQLPIVIQQL